MTRKTLAVTLLTLAIALANATTAHASWYDDYDAGLIAAKKGAWSTVVSKMTAAIKGNAKEGDRVRTYGMISINYHPYYYRGAANLHLGNYDAAIADLEKTSGPGPENLGSIESLMERAKKMASAASEPEPAPAPAPVRIEPTRPAPSVIAPPVTTPAPATPQIDPALRQRATASLNTAKQKLQSAQQRRASSSPQYTQAMSTYTDALTRSASARNNEDLNTVITMADNAGDFADLAQAPVAATPSPAIATTTPSPIVPRPDAATTVVIDEHAADVKRALELYFAGEFEEASERFEKLTAVMPNNGWIHAFLGASLYSRWAFEADESHRRAALNSFRKAKQLRTWRDGLPQKYFSKRIRDAFRDVS